MTARAHLLDALNQLYAALAAVRVEAEEEGDGWAGWTATAMEQRIRDTAQDAEVERRIRGEQ